MKNLFKLNNQKAKVYGSILVVMIVVTLFVTGWLNRQKIDFSNTFIFSCKDNKVITATFLKKDNQVRLQLTDGRDFVIPKVESASGEKYSNGDDSFVFWTKGEEAFITEGLQFDKTFIDCVVQVPPGGLVEIPYDETN